MIPGAAVTQNGDAAQYTVTAPAFSLPEEGTYQVVVTITDSSAATPFLVNGTALAVIADAHLTAGTPVALTPNTGVLLSGAEAGTFTDANTGALASDFTGTIDWGDGTAPSTANISAETTAGTFDVLGTHAYAAPGAYTTTVVVADVGGSVVTLNGSVTVTDRPLTGIARDLTAVEGQDSGNVVLATVNDPDTLATVADLGATVNWGDPGGSTVPATVVLAGGTSTGTLFSVLGSHTYAEEGSYTFTVAVTTAGGATATFTPPTGTATVADAPLSLGLGAPVSGVAGITLPAGTVLATFTDSNPDAQASEYSGTITWGDGSGETTFTGASIVTTGTPPSGQTFAVVTTAALSHTYFAERSYPVGLTIEDMGGSETTAQTMAVIADAPLVPTAAANITTTAGMPLLAVSLATFTDPNPAVVAADFTALVDWGDGSPVSLGTISGATGGPFTVADGHTYTEEPLAPYTITVQVTDDGGNTGSTTLDATVGDAALTAATGLSIGAVEGQPFQNDPLATFTDANPLGSAGDFTATINWGDGATSPGTLVELGRNTAGANYMVLGSHVYAQAGAYLLGVTVTDVGGVTTSPSPLTATATVADAPLSSSGASISGTEGLALTAQVAIFTDADPRGLANDYQATIDWGDGTGATAGTVSLDTASSTTFLVTGTHTYDQEGNAPLTVTIRDIEGGATTVAIGTAAIADAPPTAAATQPAVMTTEGTPFAGAVATFSAINGTDVKPIGDFTATIDWGDGSAPTEGTIVASDTPGIYQVTGNHTYSDSGVNIGGTPSIPAGTFALSVLVHDDGGGALTIANTATVKDVAIALAGQLNPASDSGISQSDAITNDAQPNFFGTSEPFSQISLLAEPASGGPPVLVGQTEADGSGDWTITSSVLADGSYVITARAIDAFHQTTATTQILPNASQGPLTIDTAGPWVAAVRFYRLNGEIDVTFQGSGSGLDQAQVSNAADYLLTGPHTRRGTYRVNFSSQTASGPTGPDTVVLVINNGRPLRAGIYTFTVISGAGARGVRDVAGNALDGEYYGTFPSGNQSPGGNFLAGLDTAHHLILAPQIVIAESSPSPLARRPRSGVAVLVSKPAIAIHVLPSQRHALHDRALARLFGERSPLSGQDSPIRSPRIR